MARYILSMSELRHRFLASVKSHAAPSTHEWYKQYLDSFCSYYNGSARDLTPSKVHEWIGKHYGNLAPSTQSGAARAVTRAINWAVTERLLPASPLAGMRKPQPTSREHYVTHEQYEECRKHANAAMQDLIDLLWHTGCRPTEARIITGAWIDGRKVIVPAQSAKGKRYRRVIYLNDIALAVITRRAAAQPKGPILRNVRGLPWTKDAVICSFRRLRAKTGIKGLCAYSFRHGFATESLKRGIDCVTVGVLMGHRNPGMVAKVYQHLAADDDHLIAACSR
jgi:integrase